MIKYVDFAISVTNTTLRVIQEISVYRAVRQLSLKFTHARDKDYIIFRFLCNLAAVYWSFWRTCSVHH